MFASRLTTLALSLTAAFTALALLSYRREECSDAALSRFRGMDQSNWNTGCLTCGGANPIAGTIDACDCNANNNGAWCVTCSGYSLGTDLITTNNPTSQPPGYVAGSVYPCAPRE